MNHVMRNQIFVYAKTKTQISFAVTAKLISAFVFAIWIVQSLYYLNPQFQASSQLLWLYNRFVSDLVGNRFSHNEAQICMCQMKMSVSKFQMLFFSTTILYILHCYAVRKTNDGIKTYVSGAQLHLFNRP